MKGFWMKVPAVLYAGLIFGLSSLEKTPLETLPIWNIDKIVHMIEYAVFGILLMLAFSSEGQEKISKRTELYSAIIGVLYGLSDEIHQYYVPGRISAVSDLCADAIGIILGIWFFKRLKIFRKIREA